MEIIREENVTDQYSHGMTIYSIETSRRRMVPDWRDGLKLVQRRILYSMLEAHCETNFKKTAKIIGDTMGNLHPHGDAGIGDAVKHMVNWFECYEPLIEGSGNFGSMQGDGMAAPRYTEARLSKYSLYALLSELMDTRQVTDWVNTYNNESVEPEYFPCKVPNLLINGTFGIATGFAVDIPKHNLGEVIDATINLIKNPNAPVVLIPDQCMPCDIIDTNWKSICNKGRGKFKVRARIDIEKHNECYWLIVKSTPDMVYFDKGKVKNDGVRYRIVEYVKESKIPQITDIVEDSHKNDMRIIIKLRKGSDPNFVKEVLYRNTQLEITHTVNFEVLDGIKMIRMSYKSYLQAFILQRKSRKFRYYCIKLQNAKTKYHEKETYIKLLESGDIDNIIQMIRKLKKIDDNYLMEYLIKKLNITDVQAKFIMNINLKNLSEAYLDKYKQEYKELKQKANEYLTKITHEELLEQEIIDELLYAKDKFNHPRNSRVIKVSEANGIPSGKFKVVFTENNYIRKIGENEKVSPYKGDNPKFVLSVENTENLIIFSEMGRAFKLPVHKIPIADKNSPGVDIRILVKNLMANIVTVLYEPYIKELSKSLNKKQNFLTVLTKNNCIKKMDLEDFLNVAPSGLIYTKLNDGDIVKDVKIASNTNNIVIYSDKKALMVPMTSIPHYKRSTYGVNAMNTKEPLDGFSVINTDVSEEIVVVTEKGRVNKFLSAALPVSDRNKAGNTVIKLAKDDKLLSIYTVYPNQAIEITTTKETKVIPVSDINIGSSISTGQKVISTRGDMILKCKLISLE